MDSVKYNCTLLCTLLHASQSWLSLFKKMHIDVIHEADDDISIFLYFTFTLKEKPLNRHKTLHLCFYTLKI